MDDSGHVRLSFQRHLGCVSLIWVAGSEPSEWWVVTPPTLHCDTST